MSNKRPSFLLPDDHPFEKRIKIQKKQDQSTPKWIRPAQFIARIHSQILYKYKKKEHFLYSAFVVYKSENAKMTVYSRNRNLKTDEPDEYFIFVITIEKDDVDLFHWMHTYNWNGGWFVIHLKLLCLLDQDDIPI